MKKILAVMLICFVAFSFAGCTEEIPVPTTSPVPTATAVPEPQETPLERVSRIKLFEEFADILGDLFSFDGFEKILDDQKALIVEKRLETGYESSFEGNCFIEKNKETGEVITYCGEWLAPTMAETIAAPNFGKMVLVSSGEKEFVAKYFDVTMESAKTYATILRNAGYTVNSQEHDLVSIGKDLYSFNGENADGDTAEALYVDGFFGIFLKKAQ